MKKYSKSLFIISAFLTIFLLAGCQFNLSKTQYLERPDITVENNRFLIIAPYISNQTESITIYRQDVEDTGKPIERVAILFPKGDDEPENQTFHYYDERILTNTKYSYYLRFKNYNGERNRTEWSEPKAVQTGAGSDAQLSYNVTGVYRYDPATMTLTLKNGTFTPPDSSVITDINAYNPALVFQAGDLMQVFDIPDGDINLVHLKSVLPESFLYKDITLLGIVGQKTEYNIKDPTIPKKVSWTKISDIKIVDSHDIRQTTIRLDPEHGNDGFDYSAASDNED